MYLLVEDFRQGLDTRRMFLTSKAGSLQKLKNAHITRGGEIEKRLAFANYASLPAGTFGLQAAGGILYTFGSADLASSMPSGIQYQRLRNPNNSAMTELVFSETFNGKVYAIAKYADGSVLHFFDAVLTNVTSSSLEIVSPSITWGTFGWPSYTITSAKVGTTELLSSSVPLLQNVGGNSATGNVLSRRVDTATLYTFTKSSGTRFGKFNRIGAPSQIAVGTRFEVAGATGSRAIFNGVWTVSSIVGSDYFFDMVDPSLSLAGSATTASDLTIYFYPGAVSTAYALAAAINAGTSGYTAVASQKKTTLANATVTAPSFSAATVTCANHGLSVGTIFGAKFPWMPGTYEYYGVVSATANTFTFTPYFNPGAVTNSPVTIDVYTGNVKISSPLGNASYDYGKSLSLIQTADAVSGLQAMSGGPQVQSWSAIAGSVGDNTAVAAALASQIALDANFSATSSGSQIFITSDTAGQAFTASGSTVNGGSINDQSLTFSTAQAATTAVSATGSLTVSASSTSGSITAVTVNGTTNILAGTVTGTSTTAATATAIANSINSGSSGYTAVATTNVVTITAPAGVTPNGYAITATTAGTGVTIGSFVAFSGGVDASAQTTVATVGGTFEVNDQFSVTLTIPSTGYTATYTLSNSASGSATVARTFNNKMYFVTRSLLYFSEISDPTKVNTNVNGSGFINLSNQDSGFEDLQALGIYQGKMAVFSRRAVQIWAMDPDPTKNVASQTLKNIGTFAPRSVTNFGDIDVFFLSDTGVRSLRARDASNAAAVSDVGTNIDTLIQSDLLALPEATRNAAFGIIEPTDGRYWLAVGPKIYVYSFFPSANIAAWSTYEPGFTVSHFAYANGRIYARSGDSVYLYGGTSGNQYDSSQVEVILPYLDAGKPAHVKTLQAVDMTCEGTWDVFVGCDTTVPSARDFVATVTQSTFDLARIQAAGMGTHIGVRLVTNPGYSGSAKIGNFATHFEINDAG